MIISPQFFSGSVSAQGTVIVDLRYLRKERIFVGYKHINILFQSSPSPTEKKKAAKRASSPSNTPSSKKPKMPEKSTPKLTSPKVTPKPMPKPQMKPVSKQD